MIDLPALTYPPDFLTAPIFLDSRRFPSQFFDNRWSLASEDGARPMSLMGQKRKSGDPIATSDLPLKADIKRTSRDVRFVS